MARYRKGQLEQRCVYLEGKRRTKGYQLFTYLRDLEETRAGFRRRLHTRDKTNFRITKQRHRRGFYLRGKLGVWPEPFGYFSPYRDSRHTATIDFIRD